jgi:hypothetical protein
MSMSVFYLSPEIAEDMAHLLTFGASTPGAHELALTLTPCEPAAEYRGLEYAILCEATQQTGFVPSVYGRSVAYEQVVYLNPVLDLRDLHGSAPYW